MEAEKVELDYFTFCLGEPVTWEMQRLYMPQVFIEILDVRSECDTVPPSRLTFYDDFPPPGPSVLQVMPWLSQISLLAANGLVVKRVVCMYSGDKRVFGALAFGLVVFTLYSATVIILMSKIQSVVGRIQSRSLYEVCYILPAETVPPWSWTFAIVMFVFDALVLGLSVLQGIWFAIENRQIHHGRKVGIPQHLWRTRRTIASVLLRDSILFPFIRMVMAMVIILAWTAKLPPGSAQGIMMAAAASVPTLGCKLLLNLRSAYYKPFREEYFQSQLQNGSPIIPNWSLAPASGHE
ncbi:hypothetical protein BKA70DRAFT_1565380 [Coprinopsis sp. MPI-PUGE-AT-0042]|nr:hypothetical protein BKA70DRAFT_1565380 [Coprinopsis sp. MPI-PUGE-AT-0042]